MRPPGQIWAVPRKMPVPPILARLEQPDRTFGGRIDAGNIRPFVAIAEKAPDREVFCYRRAVVLPCNDMVDRMRQRR